MAVKIKTKAGTIDIDNDVISSVVGGAATDNYGVVEWQVGSRYAMALTRFCDGKTSARALSSGNRIMELPLRSTLS